MAGSVSAVAAGAYHSIPEGDAMTAANDHVAVPLAASAAGGRSPAGNPRFPCNESEPPAQP